MTDSNELFIKALIAINTVLFAISAFYLKNSITQIESIKEMLSEQKSMYRLLELNLNNSNKILKENKEEVSKDIDKVDREIIELNKTVNGHENRITKMELTCKMKHEKVAS